MLKPGGRFLCLEFSKPVTSAVGRVYDAYSFKLIPAIGAAVAGDRDAYQLPGREHPALSRSAGPGRPDGGRWLLAGHGHQLQRRRLRPAPGLGDLSRMGGPASFARLTGAVWSLIRADALLPREIDGELPAGWRFLAVSLRLFAGAEAKKGRPGERLARALERLGPVAIKLGQLLSTRADIFGAAFAEDLSRLKDRLAPFPTEAARLEVERALGRPLGELFSSFEEPVAAASLAQAHRRAAGGRPGGGGEGAAAGHRAAGGGRRRGPGAGRPAGGALGAGGPAPRAPRLRGHGDPRPAAGAGPAVRGGRGRRAARGHGRRRLHAGAQGGVGGRGAAGADPGVGAGRGAVGPGRPGPGGPRPPAAGRQPDPRLPGPGPGPRRLPRRPARGQPVRRTAGDPDGGRLRHRRAPGAGGAALSGRRSSGDSCNATTSAWPRSTSTPAMCRPTTTGRPSPRPCGRWASRCSAATPASFPWAGCWPSCSRSPPSSTCACGPSWCCCRRPW